MRYVNWTRFALLGSLGFVALPAMPAVIWTDIGSEIFTFDSSSPGILQRVGLTGQLPMDGMDFTADGTLYGVADRDLFIIDQNTGHATLIGDELMDPNSGQIFFDLSWDPSTSTMYGLAAKGGEPPLLYEIDLDNPGATLVATIAYWGIMPPGGMATTSQGVRHIDDGYGRVIRRLGPVEDEWVQTYALPSHGHFLHCFFGGMTCDWSRDDVCYHATVNLDISPNGRTQLWTEDLTTGGATYLGDIGGGDMLLLSAAIKPVPEPAGSLALALCVACTYRRRGA